MNAPLGRSVGNALEIIECLDTLKGDGSSELTTVIRVLATRMVMLAGLDRDGDAAARRVHDALSSGRALEVFAKLIDRQGGNARIVDDYSLLPSAPDREILRATRAGFVTTMHAEAIGRASHALGAGRSRVGDAIDHGVGIIVDGHARGCREDRRSVARVASPGRTECGGGAGAVPRSDFHRR